MPIRVKTPRLRDGIFAGWSTAELAKFRGQLGQRLVKIGNETVVGNLENRRIFVLVDRHDDLRVLHAGKMLNRAGYSDRNIQLWRLTLTGLAHLPIVGGISGIDGSARRADGRAQLVCDRLDI